MEPENHEPGQNVVALHPRTDAQLVVRIRALMEADRSVTQSRIARETGFSQGAISAWIAGTYRANTAQIEAKVARWIAAYQEREQRAQRVPDPPAYVSTPTGDRILLALQHTQVTGDVAVIYGGAGLGKTTAIRRYAATGLNVWVATMTPATAAVVPALEEIAEAIGLSTSQISGAARLHRAIVKRLAGTGGLLVIDEASHLSVQALDQVRSIHDATGVGLALVGNEAVFARLTGGGTRAAYLDRLYSRIGKRLRLVGSTQADVDRLVAAWQIEDKRCRDVLVGVARRPGALRGVSEVLRLAAMRAAASGRPIEYVDLEHAVRELAPMDCGVEP